MSPITPQRPDAAQDAAAQDMNSWERVTPGQPQTAWSASRGYAIYRTTFTSPKLLQSRGGEILLREVSGDAEFFVNGTAVAARLEHRAALVQFPAGIAPVTLSVILKGDGPDAGLTAPVEVCAPS